MRYPATEKLEIIRTVETSPLSVRRTLGQSATIILQQWHDNSEQASDDHSS
jgi:hypothetical protein